MEPKCVSMLLSSGAFIQTRNTFPFPSCSCHLLIVKMLWHHLLQEAPFMCFMTPHYMAIRAEEHSESEEPGPRAEVSWVPFLILSLSVWVI